MEMRHTSSIRKLETPIQFRSILRWCGSRYWKDEVTNSCAASRPNMFVPVVPSIPSIERRGGDHFISSPRYSSSSVCELFAGVQEGVCFRCPLLVLVLPFFRPSSFLHPPSSNPPGFTFTMKISPLLVVLLPLASAAAVLEQRQSNWTVGQIVETTSGRVSGHAAKNASAAGVSEYLGIPFGKAPIGDLRFAAPEAFVGTGALNGSIYVCSSLKFVEMRLIDLGKFLPSSHFKR